MKEIPLVQNEDSAVDSLDLYESFIENFHGIVYRGNLDWIPIFIHGKVETITGYTEEEFKKFIAERPENIESRMIRFVEPPCQTFYYEGTERNKRGFIEHIEVGRIYHDWLDDQGRIHTGARGSVRADAR